MITTPDSKLFVVENNVLRYVSQKVPGQLNAPAETFKQEDIKFKNTIARTIFEEVGEIDCDPRVIQPIGLIKLNIPDLKVAAAPFLVPLKSLHQINFKPKDSQEASNYQWVEMNEVIANPSLKLGPYEVPKFRTPMVELIEMLTRFQKTGLIQIRVSKVPSLSKGLFQYLQEHPGARVIT